MQKQIDLQGMQFGKKADQVLEAAAEPIDAPGHDQIELPLGGVATQAIEFRSAVPALSAAYAMVPIDADDLAAHAGSDLAKLTLLVRRSLLGGRDPKIENSALHRNISPFCYRRPIRRPKWRVLLAFRQHYFEGFFRTVSTWDRCPLSQQSGHRNGSRACR